MVELLLVVLLLEKEDPDDESWLLPHSEISLSLSDDTGQPVVT